MTRADAEKWIAERLRTAGGEMPAAEIVAQAVSEGVASAATVHRAGSVVAVKTRTAQGYVWALLEPIKPPRATHSTDVDSGPGEADDLYGGYGLWADSKLATTATERGYNLTGRDWTQVEMCALLSAHDAGHRPTPTAYRSRMPLPY